MKHINKFLVACFFFHFDCLPKVLDDWNWMIIALILSIGYWTIFAGKLIYTV